MLKGYNNEKWKKVKGARVKVWIQKLEVMATDANKLIAEALKG